MKTTSTDYLEYRRVKTISMDYLEYKSLVDERDLAQRQLQAYMDAITTVYGRDIAENIIDRADQIETQKSRLEIQRAVHEGKF